MQTLEVDLGDRSYPIFVGSDLLGNNHLLSPYIKGQQVLVVTNDTIAPLFLDKVCALLEGYQLDTVILSDGEQYKNLAELQKIYKVLLENKHNRSTTLIALGGGVVGDMAGFAAASYQRGVDFIQIPTTILSQVDSSVGGKTGVNHQLGKNMIGAFHQPNCVIADIACLATLPKREISAGIAEIIKYGLIRDFAFFEWLEENIDKLLQLDTQAMIYAVKVSCANKAEVVAADEREGGVRAILNLGHTFGHAIETAAGYGEVLHGEAVSIGMLMAAELSARMEYLDVSVVKRVQRILEAAGLPVKAPPVMTVDKFIDLMKVDKKTLNGRLRLVLLKSIGEAVVTSELDFSLLEATISDFCVA